MAPTAADRAYLQSLRKAEEAAMGGEVCAHVKFSYKGQRWTHDFTIGRGTTVLQLKQQMLKGGSKSEVDQVELQQQGQRVPDWETISRDQDFEFYLLWPEEGAKLAREDEANRSRKSAAQVERPRARQEASRMPESNAEPKAAAPAASSREEVEVTVKHAVEDCQIIVKVQSTATVMDVRRAVMTALNEVKLSEVKIVKAMGPSFTSLTGDEPIGARREFLSMGRMLSEAAEAPKAEPAVAAAAVAAASPQPAAAAPQSWCSRSPSTRAWASRPRPHCGG